MYHQNLQIKGSFHQDPAKRTNTFMWIPELKTFIFVYIPQQETMNDGILLLDLKPLPDWKWGVEK